LKKFLATVVMTSFALAASISHAQTQAQNEKTSKQYQQELINLETAQIKTREDLIRALTNQDPANPLNKLSEAARNRLVDTLTVNSKGEISSLYIADIKSELSPTDAYKVFSLFGMPELADHVNNGKINTELDAKIQGMNQGGNRVHPATESYYCNGGYCTANNNMTCVENRCQPPR
jgi:hypothetical protein